MAFSGNSPLAGAGRSAGAHGHALAPLPPAAGAAATAPLPFVATAPNVASLWQAFRRRWLLALLVGLGAAAIAAVAAYLLISPARYTARTLLHIESRIPTI